MVKIVIPRQKLRSKYRVQFRNQFRNQDDETDVYKLSSENQQVSENENIGFNQSFVVCNSRNTLDAILPELKPSPFKDHS